MSIQGGVHRGSVWSEKYPSRKCLSGNCQSGICPWGSVSRGTVRIPIYQLKFLRGPALKSSEKDQ